MGRPARVDEDGMVETGFKGERTCGDCEFFSQCASFIPVAGSAGIERTDLECPARTTQRKAEASLVAIREKARKSRVAAQHFYKQAQNAEALLQQEQETMRALEDVAVRHGYDKETGECLTDWLDKRIEKVTCPEIVGGGARDCRFMSASRGIIIKLRKRLHSIRRQFNLVDARTDFTVVELAILEIFKSAQKEDLEAQPAVHDMVPKRDAGVEALYAKLEQAEEGVAAQAERIISLENEMRLKDEQIDHWKKKYNEKVYANQKRSE